MEVDTFDPNIARNNLSEFGYFKIKGFIDETLMGILRPECKNVLLKYGIDSGTTSYLSGASSFSSAISLLSPLQKSKIC